MEGDAVVNALHSGRPRSVEGDDDDDDDNDEEKKSHDHDHDAVGSGNRWPRPPPPGGKLLTIDQALGACGTGRFQYQLLVIAGLAFCGDAIEVMFLSFLSPCVQAAWGLTNLEAASIASVVFAGELVGSAVLGSLADTHGRRPIFIAACLIIFLSGLLSCVATSYGFLLATRAVVGFGVGGLAVPFELLAEFLLPETRGKFLLLVEVFWTLGSCYTALWAWAILNSAGWRWLALVCALPVLLVLFVVPLVPESPRWLMLQNRTDEAAAIIVRVAKINGNERQLPSDFRLDAAGRARTSNSHFKPSLLVSTPALRRITCLLFLVWAGFGAGYYGVILFITKLFQEGDDGGASSEECRFDYPSIFVSSTSEIVGLAWAMLLLDRRGRRFTQACFYSTASFFTFLLGFRSGVGMLTVCAFLARAGAMAASCATWVRSKPSCSSTNKKINRMRQI